MTFFSESLSYIIPVQMYGVTLLYIVLKLSGYLALSWWFVASPIVVSILIFTAMVAICSIEEILKKDN